MSAPVPTSDDIIHGITAFAELNRALEKFDLLREYLGYCQCRMDDTEKGEDTPVGEVISLAGFSRIMDDVNRDLYACRKHLIRFPHYIA